MSSVLRPMSSRTGLGWCQIILARAIVELFGPGPLSSLLGSGWCQSSGPGSMLSGASLGLCRVDLALVNELSERGPMSSRASPSWCRVVRAQAIVESSGFEPMLSGEGPGRCRVDWALANVEPSEPGLMSS